MTGPCRVALVTGASRGIGRAIALALARQGVRVAVNYRASAAAAEAVAAEAQRAGDARAMAVQADVRSLEDVQRMEKCVREDLGDIDILINNAGLMRDNLTAFMSEEEWRDVLDTNLTGTFHCIKVMSRGMARRRWGRIVNLSSDAGLMGDTMRANYSAAKAGVLGLTRAVARELAASNVTVNAVAPGPVETDMLHGLSESKRLKLVARVPLGRFGTPEDVASVVAFLASDDAAYITGEVLCVDGGMRM